MKERGKKKGTEGGKYRKERKHVKKAIEKKRKSLLLIMC
jgi:hypothetical protein